MRNCCHGVAIIKTFNKLAIEKKFIKEYFTLKILIATTEVTAEVLITFNKLIFGEKFIKAYIYRRAIINESANK